MKFNINNPREFKKFFEIVLKDFKNANDLAGKYYQAANWAAYDRENKKADKLGEALGIMEKMINKFMEIAKGGQIKEIPQKVQDLADEYNGIIKTPELIEQETIETIEIPKEQEQVNLFEEYATFKTSSNREEWLKLRGLGIGGSDSSIVLNQNKYKTSYQLWLEKKGEKEPEDLTKNKAVIKGVNMEKHLRELFKFEYTEYEVLEDNNTYFSKEHPFMLANIDGILRDKKTNELIGLEIKTATVQKLSNWEELDDNGEGTIPINYYIQVQHYMAVLGLDKFILYAYIKTPYQAYLKDYEIKREEEFIKYIIEQEKEFYESLQANIRPKNQLKVKI